MDPATPRDLKAEHSARVSGTDQATQDVYFRCVLSYELSSSFSPMPQQLL